jgi:hypothetical protein
MAKLDWQIALDESGASTPHFDPDWGIAVLRKLSEVAADRGAGLIRCDDPLYSSSVWVLTDTMAWLGQFTTPFENFAGEMLLTASKYRAPIPADSLASSLASAAFELAAVVRLTELRDIRAQVPKAKQVGPHAAPFPRRARSGFVRKK